MLVRYTDSRYPEDGVSVAAHLSKRGLLTFLCSEATIPVMRCCTDTSNGCSLGSMIRELHQMDALRDVLKALGGVLDVGRYGYEPEPYLEAAGL